MSRFEFSHLQEAESWTAECVRNDKMSKHDKMMAIYDEPNEQPQYGPFVFKTLLGLSWDDCFI